MQSRATRVLGMQQRGSDLRTIMDNLQILGVIGKGVCQSHGCQHMH